MNQLMNLLAAADADAVLTVSRLVLLPESSVRLDASNNASNANLDAIKLMI